MRRILTLTNSSLKNDVKIRQPNTVNLQLLWNNRFDDELR